MFKFVWCIFCVSILAIPSVFGQQLNLYVSPQNVGNADGLTKANSISYLDEEFWDNIQSKLATSDVVVSFVDGEYSQGGLILTSMGNQEHRLSLEGVSDDGVIFNGDTSTAFRLAGCRNVRVEKFNFTGPIKGYCFSVGKDKAGNPCNDIEVTNCDFYDLPELFYGCFGAHYGSSNVILSDSTFRNTGSDIYCHQVYNSYSSKNIHILNCHFEDNAGSYVRYRDGAEYGIIAGNTFVSTGNSKNYGKREIFLELSAYSSTDERNEIFGTHFWITGNTFNFSDKESDIRYGMRIHHNGFNPEGRNHLMNDKEGAILEGKDRKAKKELLLKNCGLKTNRIVFRNNIWNGEDWKVGFMSGKGKAPHDGWEGRVDISDLFEF